MLSTISLKEALSEIDSIVHSKSSQGDIIDSTTITSIESIRTSLASNSTPSIKEVNDFWETFSKLSKEMRLAGRNTYILIIPMFTIILSLTMYIQSSFNALQDNFANYYKNEKMSQEIERELNELQQLQNEKTSNPITESVKFKGLQAEKTNLDSDMKAQYTQMEILDKDLPDFRFLHKESNSPNHTGADEQRIRLIYYKSKLDSYGSHILPLMYGLLGALIFLLSEMISKNVFEWHQKDRMYLRVCLGAFAGISVGWFMHSGDTNLSPMALAFLAGYSVDLFISVLDRFANAFKSVSKAVSNA